MLHDVCEVDKPNFVWFCLPRIIFGAFEIWGICIYLRTAAIVLVVTKMFWLLPSDGAGQ